MCFSEFHIIVIFNYNVNFVNVLGFVYYKLSYYKEEEDEDKLKLTVFNSDKQGTTRQGRHTGTPGVMSRPDNTN